MNDTAESLLARAGVCRALADGFFYPDVGLPQRVLERLERARIFARAHTDLEFPELRLLRQVWSALADESLAPAYSRLFIGQDAVVLHETAYGDGGRVAGKPAELADISGFYLAFGFDLKAGERELPDHLGTELEFLSLLLVKQAYALEQGWSDKYEIARDATQSFLRDHLGRWIGAVRDSVAARGDEPGYRALFEAAAGAVARECAAFGAVPTPLTRATSDFMQAGEFVCPQVQAAADDASDPRPT